ncbi:1-deoxy-D-xylulose-5-phosphate synthase [Streptomyces beihaiensis]|uniref:1-deoxy-D-xylulose-5-phosphate synthase n=1 Tax=Streptomyces beihaiensis TaxID=2984495 RepID=A0ABT3TR14_9ACTN|nr:1-deoxy-D-xylulose-5-phosphate synthase [Streptomyces beihaiensis]MCX3059480.1 1-deoxy-D-xylulose-5-phosphate synthase [Streptomyces beihaiensis]
MAHHENGRKKSVDGTVVKVLKHHRDDRGMVLEPHTSRCVQQGEIHELVTTDQVETPPGGTVDRVGFLGFVELAGGGVLDRGDEVWVDRERIGTVLGWDACHFPNHYNVLIAADPPRTGPEIGLEPGTRIRFLPAEGHRAREEEFGTLLAAVRSPRDLRGLSHAQLADLARDIRDTLVRKVSKTGGHLGPNLGVVELTLALHRVFDSPRDQIVWDTGHQTYVHKMLTGRVDQFDALRQAGGISGYPSRAESEHDLVENSHASTALSYADGLAKAHQLNGEKDRAVVAVIGDGALTGGMCWEAINNIAAGKDRSVIIVVNDNGRSYAPTVGGLAEHFTKLRTSHKYERFLEWSKLVAQRTPVVGASLYEGLHSTKHGIKDVVAPQNLFDGLGLKYIGPVDGHDTQALEKALGRAKHFGGPVLVHTITTKGQGYEPAEKHELDRFHATGVFDPRTGHGKAAAKPARTWTSVFSEELVKAGHERPDVVAITAAMLEPTGLSAFSRAFPERTFDVGIAEQHAVTSAAGLAMNGLHPVVAMYATFLNRAFDQTLMDVALHRQPVTFVLDRAGVTGDDGASHNGMWDMSILQVVPGLRIAAPRDATRLAELFQEAVRVDDGPTAVRFPKGPVQSDIDTVDTVGGIDVLHRGASEDVLIVAVGSMAQAALDAASLLATDGVGCTVVDPRWVKPVDPALAPLAARHRLVVTVEDNGLAGGVGSAISQALRQAGVDTPLREFGIAQEFLDHAKRADILQNLGLTSGDIALRIEETLNRRASQSASYA